MELAKKSYVESYVNSRMIYINTGGVGNGTHIYPELEGAKVAILLLKDNDNRANYSILVPSSYQVTDYFTITLGSFNQIVIDNLYGTLKLYELLIFK